ncbi:interleukin-12 subunit beta [Trichomycterus rosablanca]|uniref:interleukin-12 subunit beta n=1 Tax=Trichomycterus rosablanca TaxID=2290929 RepID=UPI002F35766A
MSTALRIISVFCLCILTVSAFNTFPVKFVTGMTHRTVTLTCNTAAKEPITWKLDDNYVEIPDVVVVNGKKLTLYDLQEDLTGNYTCWSEDKLVDYTYVLLDMSPKITSSSISCMAETFNCTSRISCTMKEAGYQHFRLRNEQDTSSWVSPSEDNKFYLTHSTNPFAEESEPMVVVGEAVSSLNFYFKTSYSFYLRDIIKPGCPQVTVKKGQVVVDPPLTWTMPLSYYPLEHEIEWQQRGKKELEIRPFNSSIDIPKDTRKVRVRCRDSVLLSQWSDWTPWQNVSN